MIVRSALHWISGFLPLRIIQAEVDGGPLAGLEGSAPLFERYFVASIPRFVPRYGGGAIYLHHYLRSDPDRGVHDHPWDHAIAWQLAGGYVEERLAGFSAEGMRRRYVARPPGLFYRLSGADFHRVLVPHDAPSSWSLFIHGPYRKGWGFLEEDSYDGDFFVAFTPADDSDDKMESAKGGRPRWVAQAARGREQERAAA